MRETESRTRRGGRRRFGTTLLVMGLAGYCTVVPLAAQGAAGSVRGRVLSETGEPIAQAQVFISAIGRGTLTNSRGVFTLHPLPAGSHRLQVGRIGYAPVRREVQVSPGVSDSIEIVMEETPLSLPGIQVTGFGGGRDPLAVVQATTQLAGGELQRELAGTISATLRAQPGISVRSMGPAASMPIMRGLTGDRILVLQDGQRTADLAGSADDHGVTIDPLTVERVEVIRGPATLLYGNNALGGVVNVISGDIPVQVPERATFTLGAQSESAYPGASATLRSVIPAGDRWALSLRSGARTAGDMRIPADPVLGSRLENTEARNWSAAAGAGYVGERAIGGASVQTYDFSYGLPVPPGSDPVSLRGRRYEGTGRLDLSLSSELFPSVRVSAGVQDYRHDEIDDRTGDLLQTFVLDTRTADVLLRQGRLGPVTEGAVGVSVLSKDYAAAGASALTPPARSRGFGVFGFQAVSLGRPVLELGARFDDYRIAARDDDKFGPGRTRSFPALSGSAGLRVPLAEGVSAGVSVARSFRAPTVEELFSGAAHAGTGAVEFGNPELVAERGVSIEMVTRVQNSRWNGQLAAYRNEISDYVHLAARGDTVLYGTRLPVLTYTQSGAVLQGLEGSIEWAATRAVVIGILGDYIHAEQVDGTPLSFMPPPRLGASARWDIGSFSFGGDLHHELRQGRVGAADELPTPEHTIARLHAGARFHLGGQYHSVSVRAENLTNELHREATSRIKDFAPGPGRNLAVVYRLVF